jgi:hypothetical protein
MNVRSPHGPAANVRASTGQRACEISSWSVEEQEACFVGRDHSGQQLAYVYYENEPGRRSAAKLLTKDEARRIASNIAKLP